MNIGLAFWVIMLVAFVFGFWGYWPVTGNRYPFGGYLITWVLLALLGWKVFGPALHG